MFVSKNITIRKDQADYIRKAAINLSWLVQAILDKRMMEEEERLENTTDTGEAFDGSRAR